MDVLFVLDTWGLVGGTERHATVVIPALLERGHSITVLCRENLAESSSLNIDVPVIEFPGMEGTGLSRDERRELTGHLRAIEPDAIFFAMGRNLHVLSALQDQAPLVRYVHDHSLFCPGLNKYRENGENCKESMGRVCLEQYWLKGGCTCFKKVMHENTFLDPLKGMLAKWREMEINRDVTRILTNSHFMRGELLKVGFSPEKTQVLYYFTQSNTPAQPASAIRPDIAQFLAEKEGPLIFTPARLTHPDKGVDYLLTALHKLDQPYKAVIAGSGPAEDWLRQKAIEDQVEDRVYFTGWMESTGIEALYGAADVVVCPSVWDEPFGLVGIESMAHSKPVVAFRVGGIPEWLTDGESGFLAERKDAAGMADGITRLLEDPELAQRMGRRGRELLEERFPREAHVDGLESALLTAIET